MGQFRNGMLLSFRDSESTETADFFQLGQISSCFDCMWCFTAATRQVALTDSNEGLVPTFARKPLGMQRAKSAKRGWQCRNWLLIKRECFYTHRIFNIKIWEVFMIFKYKFIPKKAYILLFLFFFLSRMDSDELCFFYKDSFGHPAFLFT